MSTRELNALLEAAIDALPGSYRVVFMLREVEALSTAETAESLGLSEETVRGQLRRAKGQLREKLYDRIRTMAAEAYPFSGARSDRLAAAVFDRIEASRRLTRPNSA